MSLSLIGPGLVGDWSLIGLSGPTFAWSLWLDHLLAPARRSPVQASDSANLVLFIRQNEMVNSESTNPSEPLRVEVVRGTIVEAIHELHAVAVDATGTVIASAGSPDLLTYLRSSAKPFQALPLLAVGDDLSADELAVAVSSHQAERGQLAVVERLLGRTGLGPDHLVCGSSSPRIEDRLQHECSGKHAGMLLACLRHGWTTEKYHEADHPLQQSILGEVARRAELQPDRIAMATDGCGVPCFGFTLATVAKVFGQLAPRVREAMVANPDLVGGVGADDTDLMAFGTGWAAKRGAEGLFCAMHSSGTTIVVKQLDGAKRAIRPAFGSFAAGLGFDVPNWSEIPTLNTLGQTVGLTRIVA